MVVSTRRLTARGFWVHIPAGAFLCGVCMFSPCKCGYSGFFTLPKNMHVRFIYDSKLSLGVSVSMDGCLSRSSVCGPAMDWRPVQVVPCLSPNDSRVKLQRPWVGLSGYRKWMDAFLYKFPSKWQLVYKNMETSGQPVVFFLPNRQIFLFYGMTECAEKFWKM